MKKRVSAGVFGRMAVVLLLVIAGVMQSAVPVTALRTTCKERNCDQDAVGGSDYCSFHKCSVEGCTKKVSKNGYCSSHQTKKSREGIEKKTSKTCAVNGCTKSPQKNSMYCKKHTCTKKNCYRQKKSKALYCREHLKKEMPDCDDYDSFDDFMDDWDGRMPDGSDAEDYWENW